MMTDDGISLNSAPHPKPPWWRRLLSWFWRPTISKDAIEIVEIEIDRKV